MYIASASERYTALTDLCLALAPPEPGRLISALAVIEFISVADVVETVSGSHGGIGRMSNADH